MKYDMVGKQSNRILNFICFLFRIFDIQPNLFKGFRNLSRCMALIPLFNKLFKVFFLIINISKIFIIIEIKIIILIIFL